MHKSIIATISLFQDFFRNDTMEYFSVESFSLAIMKQEGETPAVLLCWNVNPSSNKSY